MELNSAIDNCIAIDMVDKKLDRIIPTLWQTQKSEGETTILSTLDGDMVFVQDARGPKY
jgi:hypothetical protein